MAMQEAPISVLFVDNTAGGVLAKRLQAVEKRLGGITSYRVRITEQAGMALSRLLPSTNPWGPGDCQRLDCHICKQQDDVQQDCRRRNILYKSECQVCRVDWEADGKTSSLMDGQGLYYLKANMNLAKLRMIK